MSELLELDGVGVEFRTRRGMLRAVDDVDLVVRVGETVGIVGESGSGKSALVKAILDVLPRHAANVTGTATFDGISLFELPRRARRELAGTEIAMVFQDPLSALHPVRTVGSTLTEVLSVRRRVPRREAGDLAIGLLRSVGLPEPERRLRQYPHELSGGMRQRVVIARALAGEPRLLLADEPTTALDVTVQAQILDLLADQRERLGMAIVLISHDLAVVAGRTDRVVVLYAGRVVETGGTVEVFGAPRMPYTAALIAATPRLDADVDAGFRPIPGRPPQVVDPRPGCRFADRCDRATTKCREQTPPLVPVEPSSGHHVACWHPLDQPSARAGASTQEGTRGC